MEHNFKVIPHNQTVVPFLGDQINYIPGLDPLGLQNVSDATFARLLPGLNNVTERIRYYSFYCWLLDVYSREADNPVSEEQRAFIRKAELLIALCSQFYEGDKQRIPGSSYAGNLVQRQEIHNLLEGAFQKDGSTADTYWNFSWGAFGQYYRASMRDIGIILFPDQKVDLYARTESSHKDYVSGAMLAAAFEGNVDPAKRERFIRCLQNNQVSNQQLRELLPDFNLTKVPGNSKEQELLLKLLLQKDYPRQKEENGRAFRRNTTLHLLKYAQTADESWNDRTFISAAYETKGRANHQADSTLFGWYYYQFNELWQFANSSILEGSLDYLRNQFGYQWVALPEFLDQLAENVSTYFVKEGYAEYTSDSLTEVLKRLPADEYQQFSKTRQAEELDKVNKAFATLFAVYAANREELSDLRKFGATEANANEDAISYLRDEFQTKKDLPLWRFIREYLHSHIIYRHQYVAFRKMAGDQSSTEKFIIEDFHIRLIQSFRAGNTGPRIQSLIAFLRDLNVLDPHGGILPKGYELFNQEELSDD